MGRLRSPHRIYMKRINTPVTLNVPSWSFCNIDRIDISGDMPTETCQFCNGSYCSLYSVELARKGRLVYKHKSCINATAGKTSTIIVDQIVDKPDPTPAGPTVNPKDLILQTIDTYNKVVNDLLKQGYPRSMAEIAAKKHITGGK